jgi:hypothetical protein
VTEKLQREVEGRRWTQEAELLATLAELVHMQYAAFVAVNSKAGAGGVEPLRIPRPGQQAVEERAVSPRDLIAMVGQEEGGA